jgi:hypothetical protein
MTLSCPIHPSSGLRWWTRLPSPIKLMLVAWRAALPMPGHREGAVPAVLMGLRMDPYAGSRSLGLTGCHPGRRLIRREGEGNDQKD